MQKKFKIIIAVLIALILISLSVLAVRIIYLNFFADKTLTVSVPDNVINKSDDVADDEIADAPVANNPGISGDEDSQDKTNDEENQSSSSDSYTASKQAAVIELYKKNPGDNKKFDVGNMLPGDVKTKFFAVEVNHHADVKVYFKAEVTKQTKNLADVLNIKITHMDNKKVIYDGAFADMDEDGYKETFKKAADNVTTAYYKIEVSLPEETGNEYQNAKLSADFSWYVKDTGKLDTPKTGYISDLYLWIAIMVCSLCLIVILLFVRRKEREDVYIHEK